MPYEAEKYKMAIKPYTYAPAKFTHKSKQFKSLREEYVVKSKSVTSSQSIDVLKRRHSIDHNKPVENAKAKFDGNQYSKYKLNNAKTNRQTTTKTITKVCLPTTPGNKTRYSITSDS
jgi:hypothetical protein